MSKKKLIKEIPLTKAKTQLRYRGIALSRAEKVSILKINEIIKELNKIEK